MEEVWPARQVRAPLVLGSPGRSSLTWEAALPEDWGFQDLEITLQSVNRHALPHQGEARLAIEISGHSIAGNLVVSSGGKQVPRFSIENSLLPGNPRSGADRLRLRIDLLSSSNDEPLAAPDRHQG